MSSFFALFKAQAYQVVERTLQQSYLALSAILIATVICIPLGILIAKKPRLRQYVLGFNSIIQTLPSLAVLGLLLPVFGIGIKTALIALILYALLPIIRNTAVGILNISPDLLEAANGLGLTRFQRIRLVELPLAIPIIIAGIRTATAMAIGISTLAALIGAGGLGEFIYEGLALNNVNLILLGAIPAALLALFFDFLIGYLEKILTLKHLPRSYSQKSFWRMSLVATCVVMVFYFVFAPASSSQENIVRVGSKNFSEQLILGEILAQMIEAKTNLKVDRTFNLGGTFICHRAILKNEIDIYPEYTGTSYSVILNEAGLQDPVQVFRYVSEAYLQKFNLVWLKEFGFNNTNALAVTQQLAQRYHLNNIEDLARVASQLTIGVPADFMERPDGFIGLKNKYHIEFKQVRLMDVGLMYKALYNNELDAIMAFSTDARLRSYNLVVLTDNRHLFPPYYAAPVIRMKFLEHHPEISNILSPLAGKITNEKMRQLNYQVDVMRRTPEDVAKEFLVKNHLLANLPQ
jgi:osmoprotectant transport system permease protein